MVHRWAVSALGVALCAVVATTASGQAAEQRPPSARWRGALGQNDPNPFSAQTTIPFRVGEGDCASDTLHHTVTLRIYNILSQVVAFAALVDSASADQSSAGTSSRTLSNLALGCGSYVARWDGKHAKSGREAAPGVYMYQLLIDGRAAGMKKMLLQRDGRAPQGH